MSDLIPFTTNDVMARIIKIRGQEVLLDRDVAELYGVETKRINEALRNNPDKFPEGYVFTLQPSEKQEVVENFHRFETRRKSHDFSTFQKNDQVCFHIAFTLLSHYRKRQLGESPNCLNFYTFLGSGSRD